MPPNVVAGATTTCTMGAAPSTLMVIPGTVLVEGRPAATIADSKPMVNIIPFGTCKSPLNPMTAAATIAAGGNLTPGGCVPATGAPWTPGAPTAMIAGLPALTASSKCICSYGGVISVLVPGTVVTQTT